MNGRARFAGRFEIEPGEPKRGGMGVVYCARDARTGRRVALKLLAKPSERVRARFEAELELLSRLRSPGIVEYVDHGRTDAGELYLAMEWLEGEDLERRLRRGRLSIDDALTVGLQIARGLAEVHRHGVVHRDLKPANVFLPGRRPQAAKLLDFGVAQIQERRRTSRHAMLGTPGYMSPEQARNQPLTPASDVFAFGLVLFECLTGMPVYSGANAMALLVKAAVQSPPRLDEERPDLPPRFSDALADMLAMDPSDRIPDGEALLDALTRLQAARGGTPEGPLTPASLMTSERELVSVVLVDPTLSGVAPELLEERAAAVLGRAVVRGEWLANGSLLVLVRSGAGVDAQASIAARLAIALGRAVPGADVALATGRVPMSASGALGGVIDRATGLLSHARGTEHAIIDELTAGLIGRGFQVREADDALRLVSVADPELSAEESRFVGRDRELGELTSLVELEPAQLVTVIGEPGIGKSALVREASSRMARRVPGLRVMMTRVDPSAAQGPYGVLAALLRAGLGLALDDGPQTRTERLLARLAPRVRAEERDRVMAFAGALLGADRPTVSAAEDALEAATRDPQLMSQHIRRAWEDWLVAERRDGPLLLIVDDAHFGDTPSIDAIRGALSRRGLTQVHVVLAGRAALAAHDAHRVFVEPLEDAAARELARGALGPLATDPDVERVVAAGGGSPLFLIELARAVAAGEATLPSSLVAMVESRVASLPAAARRALRAASVFGVRAPRGGLVALLGAEADSVIARAETTLDQEPLVTRRGDLWTFHSALLQEAAYATMTDDDRALGHELAAAWLSAQGDVDPLVLAEHHTRSGHPERAIAPIREAAELALQGHDFPRARRLAESALDAGAEGEARAEALLVAARARRFAGNLDESFALAAEALELLPERSDAWFEAAMLTIWHAADAMRVDVTAAVSERLMALEPRPEERIPMLRALATALIKTTSVGLYDLALLVEHRVDALVGELRSMEPYVAASVHHARSGAALHRQDLVAFRQHTLDAIDANTQIGDRRQVAALRINAAYGLNELGECAAAEAELQQAAALCVQLGQSGLLAAVEQNLGETRLTAGRPHDAIESAQRAREAFVASGNDRHKAAALLTLTSAYRQLGELDAAEACAQEAVEALEPIPNLLAGAYAELSLVLLARDLPEQALRWAEAGHELLKSLGGQVEGRESTISLARAKALWACGDRELARHAIEVAARALEARAAQIADPQRRATFLNGSPERREILRMRQEWTTAS